MEFVIADVTRKLGLPADSTAGEVLAALRAPEGRVLAELGAAATATPSDGVRLFARRHELRVIGYQAGAQSVPPAGALLLTFRAPLGLSCVGAAR
jgi:hypothetical protein